MILLVTAKMHCLRLLEKATVLKHRLHFIITYVTAQYNILEIMSHYFYPKTSNSIRIKYLLEELFKCCAKLHSLFIGYKVDEHWRISHMLFWASTVNLIRLLDGKVVIFL